MIIIRPINLFKICYKHEMNLIAYTTISYKKENIQYLCCMTSDFLINFDLHDFILI